MLAGALTFVATVLVFWTTGIRDRYADERITANEALTAQAKAEAAQAQKLTASIETENLRLLTRLEEERAARLVLEKSIVPRRLTSDQKDYLSNSLRQFSGQLVRVISPQNTEGNDYALDFIEVFTRAGWRVLNSGTSMGVTFIGYDIEPRGIQLAVSDDAPGGAKIRSAAKLFVEILHEQGLRTNQTTSRPFVGDEIDVLEFGVGVKPGSTKGP